MTTVIFDFDGTIINTNTLIEDGLNFFAHRYRGYRLSADEMFQLVGKPLDFQLRYIHPEKAPAMMDQFKIWYAHHHNSKVAPFPGMIRLIKKLKESGYRLAIVSNNSNEFLHMGLTHLGIRQCFDQIVSRETVKKAKPSSEGIEKVLKSLKINACEAIFIGDTENDICASKEAGVKSILVGWSALPKRYQLALHSDFIANSTIELYEIIKRETPSVAV